MYCIWIGVLSLDVRISSQIVFYFNLSLVGKFGKISYEMLSYFVKIPAESNLWSKFSHHFSRWKTQIYKLKSYTTTSQCQAFISAPINMIYGEFFFIIYHCDDHN